MDALDLRFKVYRSLMHIWSLPQSFLSCMLLCFSSSGLVLLSKVLGELLFSASLLRSYDKALTVYSLAAGERRRRAHKVSYDKS